MVLEIRQTAVIAAAEIVVRLMKAAGAGIAAAFAVAATMIQQTIDVWWVV